MLRIQRVSILLFVGLLYATIVHSQGFAIRNNLLYDATLTPNFGVETRLDSVWTMGLNAGFNLWDYDKAKNKKWRHILISPNFRHYNDTLFRKSFWGLHAVYSHYNVSNVKFPFGMYKDVRDKRLQGDLVAIGGSVGYNWWLTGRMHLEAEIGLALAYTWYKEYECATCGAYLGKSNKFFLLPKLGLNLVWSIGRKPEPRIVEPLPQIAPIPVAPVKPVVHEVSVNTGRAGQLEKENPVLRHISQYRPYDRTQILRRDKAALYVHFPVSSSIIAHDFRNNAATLDRIVDITRQITADSTSQVKCIQIIGLASIEGGKDANERLSEKRANALKDYVQQHIATPDSIYEVIAGGEAWADFRDQLVEMQEAGDKQGAMSADELEQAIKIIDNEPDETRREQQLRRVNGGKTWKYLKKNILADQRNSGYIRVYYDYVPDTAAAIINEASELLQTDCGECHHKALKLLEGVRDDQRAQNALGVALYLCGNKQEALEHFRRASENGNEDAAKNLKEIERTLNRE